MGALFFGIAYLEIRQTRYARVFLELCDVMSVSRRESGRGALDLCGTGLCDSVEQGDRRAAGLMGLERQLTVSAHLHERRDSDTVQGGSAHPFQIGSAVCEIRVRSRLSQATQNYCDGCQLPGVTRCGET